MSILRILSRSAREALSIQRIAPFFLIYFSFGILLYLLTMSLVNIMATPPRIVLDAPIAVAGMIAMSLLTVAATLGGAWFAAALVQSVKSGKTMGKSMHETKRMHLHVVSLVFITIILFAIIQALGPFKYAAAALLDIVIILAFPALVLRKMSFDTSIGASFRLFRKNVLKTAAFWALNRAALVLMLIFGLFVVSISAALLLFSSMSVDNIRQIASSPAMRIEAASVLLSNGFWMVMLTAVASFFIAMMTVFDFTSRTYFFLELTGRKQRKVGRRRK